MLKQSLALAAALTFTLGILSTSSVQANSYAQPAQNTPKLKVATPLPKPPQCGPGFAVKNKQLKTSGGKSWYEYSCEQEKNIYRLCNPGQSVLVQKNTFAKLAGPPTQDNSILRMTYSCGMLEG